MTIKGKPNTKAYNKGRKILDTKAKDIMNLAKRALDKYKVPEDYHEDILQDVLLNVYKYTYNPAYNISTYVWAVTRGTVANYWKVKTRREGIDTSNAIGLWLDEQKETDGLSIDEQIFTKVVENTCNKYGAKLVDIWLDAHILGDEWEYHVGTLSKNHKCSPEYVKNSVQLVSDYMKYIEKYTDISIGG
jgi:hypothetical protein